MKTAVLKVIAGAEFVLVDRKSVGTFPITDGSRLSFGRAGGNAVFLNATVVSGRHCEVVMQDGVLEIRDLGSRNGTLVNGVRVSPQRESGTALLSNGDKITIAFIEFEVKISEFDDAQPSVGTDAGQTQVFG